MYEKILKDIKKKAYFAPHKKVLIAVSGGVDSMNLLHFLYLYHKNLGIEIAIAHLNHKQRLESEEEEAYLRSWAKEKNIPIYVDSFLGIFSEKAARDYRYAFFKRVMFEEGYTALVTAHHADDQVETIFMRLLRGSRLRHLSGIQSVSPFANGELIRPFLHISKSSLPSPFHFEDSSNHSSFYLRNRIRNTYLPILEQENPQFRLALQYLGEESQLLFQAFQDLTAHIDITNHHVFLNQTVAVQEFLFQNYLESFSELQVSHRQFQEILNQLRTKSNLTYYIKDNYYLIQDYNWFKIEKIIPKTDREVQEKMIECGDVVQFGQYQFYFNNKVDVKGIPLYNLTPILLRRRRPGDTIDFGGFSKKIRRLFIDEKVPSQERVNAVIGEQNGKVLFVRIDDKTYLRKASKHDIMFGKLYIEKIRNR